MTFCFLYLPFECPCNTELTWMNKWVGLCTNRENRKDSNVLLPFRLWRVRPKVSDPWLTLSSHVERSLAMVQLQHLTCPQHDWTIWREEGEGFMPRLPACKLWCYWVWAPPGGWKRRNDTWQTGELLHTHFSSPQQSFRYSSILKKKILRCINYHHLWWLVKWCLF